MRRIVVGSVILLSLAVLSLGILLREHMPFWRKTSLPAGLETKALEVTREYLAGKYESVFEHLSEVRGSHNKALDIRATSTYRAKGKWVSRLKPSDVRLVRTVRYSPAAKAFIIYMHPIADGSDHMVIEKYLKEYIEYNKNSQSISEILNKYTILEVVVGDNRFLQVWRRDGDGEWRLLSWPLDGDPETVEGWLRQMRREGITP